MWPLATDVAWFVSVQMCFNQLIAGIANYCVHL